MDRQEAIEFLAGLEGAWVVKNFDQQNGILGHDFLAFRGVTKFAEWLEQGILEQVNTALTVLDADFQRNHGTTQGLHLITLSSDIFQAVVAKGEGHYLDQRMTPEEIAVDTERLRWLHDGDETASKVQQR